MATDILFTIRNTATELISFLLLVISLSFFLSIEYSTPSYQNNHLLENATEISTADHLDSGLVNKISLLTSTTTQSFQVSNENTPFSIILLPQSSLFGYLHAGFSWQAIKSLRYTNILNQLHYHFFFF